MVTIPTLDEIAGSTVMVKLRELIKKFIGFAGEVNTELQEQKSYDEETRHIVETIGHTYTVVDETSDWELSGDTLTITNTNNDRRILYCSYLSYGFTILYEPDNPEGMVATALPTYYKASPAIVNLQNVEVTKLENGGMSIQFALIGINPISKVYQVIYPDYLKILSLAVYKEE